MAFSPEDGGLRTVGQFHSGGKRGQQLLKEIVDARILSMCSVIGPHQVIGHVLPSGGWRCPGTLSREGWVHDQFHQNKGEWANGQETGAT